MRIVHIITRLIIGGAQENTILSCEGLARRGHDVTLIAGPTTGPEGSLVDRARCGRYVYNEEPRLVRAVRPFDDLAALRRIGARLREMRPDIVHTHSSKAGILGRLAAKSAGVPHIVHTVHGMSFNRTQSPFVRRAYAAAERICARDSAAIVCVADAMRDQMLAARIGKPHQYLTIRSGMETDDFDPAKADRRAVRREWGVRDEEVVVATIARLFVNKGYEQLIPIMEKAAQAEPRLRFVWVGDGAHRSKYEAELARRGLRERMTLTGLVPPREIPRILGGADILAHASQWEGLPRAVVQALLMTRPAVSFAIDGAPEVVIPGQTGELAPMNDLDAFAAAIVKLARDAALRERYGAAGRERCLAEFDHEYMVDQLDRLYRQLAEEGQKRGKD